MMLSRRQKNRIYETIAKTGLDPAQCDLKVTATKVVITHNSGSKYETKGSKKSRVPFLVFNIRKPYKLTPVRYKLEVMGAVVDSGRTTRWIPGHENALVSSVKRWASSVQSVVEAPDLWEEMKRSQAFIADYQNDQESLNTPFTLNEQDEIAARLQEIMKSLVARFDLASDQMERIEEKLDEAAEASKRMGRKDWLLLFGGTIFTLIVTDAVTPGVAGHIFEATIHGLIHLFTGGTEPPPLPPSVIA